MTFSKKNAAKILLLFVVASLVTIPIVSLAAQNQSGGNISYATPSLWPTGFWGPIAWCTGSTIASANPTPSPTPGTAGQTPPTCTNLCDLIGTFINVVYLMMSIAIFILTPVLFVWGGIMVMFSGANPHTLETGKKILIGTVIGIAIVLCAYLLVNTALKILNVTSVGGFNGDTAACSINP